MDVQQTTFAEVANPVLDKQEDVVVATLDSVPPLAENSSDKAVAKSKDYINTINTLRLTPTDRIAFLRSLAFNLGNYQTSYRDESSKKVIYQRLAGEEFTNNVIKYNHDYINDNGIFPAFNFFTAPTLGNPGDKFIALLSNGLYVAAEVILAENGGFPEIQFDVIEDDKTLGKMTLGYNAIVCINKQYDLATVNPFARSLVLEATVPLVLDSAENKRKHRLENSANTRLALKASQKAIKSRAKSKAQAKARKNNRKK